jgi:hypothetical protein
MYNAHDPSQPPTATPQHDPPPYTPEPAPPAHVPPNPAPSYPPAAAVAPPAPRADLQARARTAGIALLVAAGLMLLAALTKAWFTAAGSDGGVGLLGLEKCRGGLCQSATWFDIKRIPTQIPIFATTALLATIATVALTIHGGVMLLQNRAEAVKLKWISQLLGLTSFGMIAFVFSLSIGDWSRGLSVGWSTFVGIGGLIGAAAVTATMVRPLAQRS